jgi:hypothetical protein
VRSEKERATFLSLRLLKVFPTRGFAEQLLDIHSGFITPQVDELDGEIGHELAAHIRGFFGIASKGGQKICDDDLTPSGSNSPVNPRKETNETHANGGGEHFDRRQPKPPQSRAVEC